MLKYQYHFHLDGICSNLKEFDLPMCTDVSVSKERSRQVSIENSCLNNGDGADLVDPFSVKADIVA